MPQHKSGVGSLSFDISLRHLRIERFVAAQEFASPKQNPGKFKTPPREQAAHGRMLEEKLLAANEAATQRIAEAPKTQQGTVLYFASSPSHELALKSLESVKAGIELLSVTMQNGRMVASVFVPAGKLNYFKTRFHEYLTKTTKPKPGKTPNPSHKKLVESIDDLGLASINHLWTDQEPFPSTDQALTWEVWIRTSSGSAGNLAVFQAEATAVGLELLLGQISFPDRVVVLVHGKPSQFVSSITLLDVVAELRRAKECATTYVEMSVKEQVEWVWEAISRVVPPGQDANAVCLLDTGISSHPLLDVAVTSTDVHTCFPTQPLVDQVGHGTEMAGLSLYGDLVPLLGTTHAIALSHRLESVKIKKAVGTTHPDLWGYITLEAVSRAGLGAPSRQRVFCLTVSSTDYRDLGLPSSWSAAVDAIAFGSSGQGSLFFIAAGNTDPTKRIHYPHSNMTDGIHDPGQSWNGLTIGAHTENVVIRSPSFAGYKPQAIKGDLSPSSTTSMLWGLKSEWPIKPDIVMEGGNSALDPTSTISDSLEDLSLLSTARRTPVGRMLAATGDTSAATALAARMGAQIQSQYSDYWPETIRGLMVHSADWTPTMRKHFGRGKVKERMRCFGHGVPNLRKALWCASNALTLISQVSLRPFRMEKGKIVYHHMHLYRLPWPKDVLQSLGSTPVTMRITLSYFIEPSPGRRGWKYSHRYASHGLRFDLIRPEEVNENVFVKRLNKQARSEEEKKPGGYKATGEPHSWVIGSQLRNHGSLHSDIWTGTGSQLAACNLVGIYPVTGWWRERPKFGRYSEDVRYSLVISIETPNLTTDIYSPVATQIEQLIKPEVVTQIETD